MTAYIIPTIGSGGFFTLASPFDNLVAPGDRYICKAIRKLSEYYSNNEDPKVNIYEKYGIADDIFESHRTEDIAVASLQSEKGHWLHVPVSYVLKYPDPNGVPYRAISLVIALPAMPVDTVTGPLETDLKNLIIDYLGVNSVVKTIETSRVALVSTEQHRSTQTARDAVKTANNTDRGRYAKLMNDHQKLLDRIAELELYILNTNPPTP